MQTRFVEGVLAGEKPGDAALAAGYSPTTHPNDILDHIRRTLESHGVTIDKLAEEYNRGIDLSTREGARDLDLTAHSQYLKQLGWLLGANRKAVNATPAVAVQINNNSGRGGSVNGVPVGDDAALHEPGELEAATRSALAELRTLRGDIARVDEEISRRELADLLGGDPGSQDPAPHT